MTEPSLSGRRAIVTGASRGIGAATAQRLAAEGADIAIVARTLDEHDHLAGSLNETAARVAAAGRRVVVLTADLSDAEARAGIVPAAVEGLGGPIDILVNNAAAAMYAPTDTYPLHRRRITFEVNVHAPLDLAQAVLPEMLERGEGWIVNLTSASARPIPAPTLTVYGASKAALNRMTLGLAHELADRGLRINTVEPRAAVLSEGATVLVGDRLTPDMIESMEEMVEAVVALCRCSPELNARSCVSLDLIAELGLEVRALDGSPLEATPS